MEPRDEQRRLTTILAADVVGYSRLMGEDEAGTLAALKAHRRELIEPKTAQYNGRVVKLMGDGALLEFGSVVDAVRFAVEVQAAMHERATDIPEDRRIHYRIGINIGDIIVDGDDIYGDGVNIASRLEGLAEPGGICIARNVFNQVKGKLDLSFEPLGAQQVKNIAEPIEVYRVPIDDKAIRLQTPVGWPAPSRLWRWAAAAAVVVLALIVGGGYWTWENSWRFQRVEAESLERMAYPLADRPSVAVLPFTNMSGDPEQEYFGLGLSEDLITDLSKLRGLRVVARNSSFAIAEGALDAREIAETLGTRYLVEGSVRRGPDRLRVNAQLVDSTTGDHIWAERWDRPAGDVFAIQDELRRKIVAALDVQLSEGEQASAWRQQTDDPVAYDLFLRGRALKLELSRDASVEAIGVLEAAVERDPDFAAAWVWLGWVYWAQVYMGIAEDHEFFTQKTIDAAQRAIEIDRLYGDPHALLADVAFLRSDLELAQREAELAVRLSPRNADNLAMLAGRLAQKRPQEALDLIERANRLNPIPPAWYYNVHGQVFLALGEFDDAVSKFEDCLVLAPEFVTCHTFLAAAHLEAGHYQAARESAAQLVRIIPDYSLHEHNFWIMATDDPVERDRRVELLRSVGLPE